MKGVEGVVWTRITNSPRFAPSKTRAPPSWLSLSLWRASSGRELSSHSIHCHVKSITGILYGKRKTFFWHFGPKRIRELTPRLSVRGTEQSKVVVSTLCWLARRAATHLACSISWSASSLPLSPTPTPPHLPANEIGPPLSDGVSSPLCPLRRAAVKGSVPRAYICVCSGVWYV